MPTLVIGAALSAVLLGVFINTRRIWSLAAVVVVCLLAIGLLIEALIHGPVRAIEANDVEAVLASIDPASEPLRAYARTILSRLKVRRAKVANLSIAVNRLTSPPSATVSGVGRIEAADVRGTTGQQNYVRPFTVRLSERGSQWYIGSYEEFGRLR